MSEKLIAFTFDGVALTAQSGQSVAAAMLINEKRVNRETRFEGKPRGIFCGIGSCFDCLVVIDGVANQRACITEVNAGMNIETQRGAQT